jgi:hypothetical protein
MQRLRKTHKKITRAIHIGIQNNFLRACVLSTSPYHFADEYADKLIHATMRCIGGSTM